MSTPTTKIILITCIGVFALKTAKAQQQKMLPEFTQVEAGQVFDIQLYPSDSHSIYFESLSENEIKAEVENGILKLSNEKKISGPIKVKIYFKELKGLKLDGMAIASNSDTIAAVQQFFIQASGASKVNMIIKSDLLKVEADGASHITISGTAASANLVLLGANEFKAYDLTTQKTTIQTSGAANAQINVKDLLSAKAGGASHIFFTGKPAIKSISITGAGSVKDRESGEDFKNDLITGLNNEGDTTKFKIGKKRFMIIDEEKKDDIKAKTPNKKKKMKSVWGGFALGVTSMTTPDMYFNFSSSYKFLNTKMGESWFFDLNLPEYDAQIIRNKLAITTGLGMQWNNIHFEGNSYLTPNSDTLGVTNSGVKLNLNKLFTYDFTAPLLIKFASGTKKNSKKGFHLAAGVIGHYIVTSSGVTETTSNGYFQRTDLHDNFNINPFRLDATVRLGYDRLKLFANYSLTPYFDTSKAPDVRIFAAGITLIGF